MTETAADESVAGNEWQAADETVSLSVAICTAAFKDNLVVDRSFVHTSLLDRPKMNCERIKSLCNSPN